MYFLKEQVNNSVFRVPIVGPMLLSAAVGMLNERTFQIVFMFWVVILIVPAKSLAIVNC